MSGSTSSGTSFAQQVATYISQNVSGPVASISAAATTHGSQLAARYISAGLQSLESAMDGATPSSSTSSLPFASTSGIGLSSLIQEGISQLAPQLSTSGSTSLNALVSAGIQGNLPTGVSLNGSTLSVPSISTPFGSCSASVQNGILSVTPASGINPTAAPHPAVSTASRMRRERSPGVRYPAGEDEAPFERGGSCATGAGPTKSSTMMPAIMIMAIQPNASAYAIT